jgi:flagellin
MTPSLPSDWHRTSLPASNEIYDTGNANERLVVSYSADYKDLDGYYVPVSFDIQREQDVTDKITQITTKQWVSQKKSYTWDGIEGVSGYDNGKSYGSAWIDFSGLGTDYQLSDLFGQGFNSTCATCNNHYNITFTDQPCTSYTGAGQTGVNYTYQTVGSNKQLLINISACTSGADIVKDIMEASNVSSGITDHYTQYAVDSNDPSKIYIYDDRNRENNGGASVFEQVTNMGNNPVVDDQELLWIQSGTIDEQGFYIIKPVVNMNVLDIEKIDVLSYEDASAALDTCDSALDWLNSERARIGATVNRLEKAVSVDDIMGENTQAAESQISDADMAEEMVEYSKRSILEQAGQAILAQANQNPEGITELLPTAG